MRFNDKPVVTFSCLSVIQGQDKKILDYKGSAVTFRAYMPADKEKVTYTFNAFDEVRERVLKMRLQKGSRIMVVAVLKNYIDQNNLVRQSFTVSLIDYLPADDNQLMIKPDNKPVQQTQTKQQPASMPNAQRNYSGAATASYQRQEPQQPMQAVAVQRKPYSYEQSEVDIDEFAIAMGCM